MLRHLTRKRSALVDSVCSNTTDSRKRDWILESSDEELGEPCPKRQKEEKLVVDKKLDPHEVIQVDDYEDPIIQRGIGSKDDPFTFHEWSTRNNILGSEEDNFLEISDDEEVEDRMPQNSRSPSERSPTPTSKASTTPLENLFLEHDAQEPDVREIDDASEASFYEWHAGSGLHMRSKWASQSPNPSVNSSRACAAGPSQSSEVDSAKDSEEEDDDQSCMTSFDNTKLGNLAYQPWAILKKKGRKDEGGGTLPGLTLSQDTVDTVTSETPDSSQDDSMHWKVVDDTKCITAMKGKESSIMATMDQQLGPGKESIRWEDEYDWNKPIPVKKRKRLFFYTYWMIKRSVLKEIVYNYYSTLAMNKDSESCWLYKGPRLPKPPTNTLGVNVGFKHNGRPERLTINLTFISMLLKGMLSRDQVRGIVEDSWHASHLCGNWTCLNERHIHPEPGTINVNRNSCFRDKDGPCVHIPPCLKHLKVAVNTLRPTLAPLIGSSRSSINFQEPESTRRTYTVA